MARRRCRGEHTPGPHFGDPEGSRRRPPHARTASGRGYRLLGNWTIKVTYPAVVIVATLIFAERPFVSNLPLAEDLIGRASAVLQLEELLSTYRAVTLTGTGGIGKTRLALEVARSLLPKFEDACCIVEFGSVSDPKLVSSSVAGVLGLQLGGNEISPVSVARSIGGRKLLLLLDNCEHVIDDAAALAHAIMRICPRASLLVTSREILRIDGEHVYRVHRSMSHRTIEMISKMDCSTALCSFL